MHRSDNNNSRIASLIFDLNKLDLPADRAVLLMRNGLKTGRNKNNR
jgi:hypothetical protein